MLQQRVKDIFLESRKALDHLIENKQALNNIVTASEILSRSLSSGKRVYSCGNGGSMADAIHFAEELTGRFRHNRRPFAATAISDPGHISCVANDFGYEQIFARYIDAHGSRDDILFAISTSGASKNILLAAEKAREKSMTVISLTGRENSPLHPLSDCDIATPSLTKYADRVQELHIKCIHVLVELVEFHIL